MTITQLVDSLAIKFEREEDNAFRLILRDDILVARSAVIKQLAQNSNPISPILFQTVDCFKVTKVTDNDCGKGNYIFRTIEKIPRPIILSSGFVYLTIFSTYKNKRVSINLIRPEQVELFKYNRFTNSLPFGVYENEYLYFGNAEGLEYVSFSILAENPFTVSELNNFENSCCENCKVVESNCFDDAGDLIIEDSLVTQIKIIIFNEYNRKYSTEEIKVQELSS